MTTDVLIIIKRKISSAEVTKVYGKSLNRSQLISYVQFYVQSSSIVVIVKIALIRQSGIQKKRVSVG